MGKDMLTKRLLILAGSLSLGLGILGIVVPLLPTTPFLLLAASCYLRSSTRLYRWLVTQRQLGFYIYCYQHHRAVSPRSKVFTILLLLGSIGTSLILLDILWVQLVLLIIAIGVTIHLVSLKNLTPEMRREYEEHRVSLIEDQGS